MLKNFATQLLSKTLIYLELGKWHVTCLILMTVWVGMSLASAKLVSLPLSLLTLVGIGLVAIAAGALNHFIRISSGQFNESNQTTLVTAEKNFN